MVIEEAVEIQTPDGRADGYLYRHDDGGRRPAAMHLPDIGGIRPSHRGMARRLAEAGYTVLMPNAFYRSGPAPLFDLPINLRDERTVQKFGALSGPLTPDAVERDAAAFVAFLARQTSAASGPMGVVGYCFAGAMALRTAAARPDAIGAAASFHGGRLYVDGPASPHLLLPRVKARLYFGHAVEDRGMPPEAIAKFEDALRAWAGVFESETYAGALHGWTVPDHPVYNPPQAERAFAKLTELFAASLSAGA